MEKISIFLPSSTGSMSPLTMTACWALHSATRAKVYSSVESSTSFRYTGTRGKRYTVEPSTSWRKPSLGGVMPIRPKKADCRASRLALDGGSSRCTTAMWA